MRYFLHSGREKRCGMSFLSHAVITIPRGHTPQFTAPEPEGRFQSVLELSQHTMTTHRGSAGRGSEFSHWKVENYGPSFRPSSQLQPNLPLQNFPNLSTLVCLFFKPILCAVQHTHTELTASYSYSTFQGYFFKHDSLSAPGHHSIIRSKYIWIIPG